MRRINHYYTQNELNVRAKSLASEAQKPVLDKLLETGFEVVKILTIPGKNAISIAHPNVSGWLTYDGVFHRPVKGKKHVSVNTRTLERVW